MISKSAVKRNQNFYRIIYALHKIRGGDEECCLDEVGTDIHRAFLPSSTKSAGKCPRSDDTVRVRSSRMKESVRADGLKVKSCR